MNNFYRVLPLKITDKAAFAEASADELRVLLALIERSGEVGSIEDLASASSVSLARCTSAISFWEVAGVISPECEPRIIDEFEERVVKGEIDEVASVKVAESIRDENLACMLDECAALIGTAALSNAEIKQLSALCTQYSLSPEYVVTLAAHLSSKKKLTVRILTDEAIRLEGRGVDKLETLEIYIKSCDETNSSEWEFRRVMGIYGKTSKSQREYFQRWSEEFGYTAPIVEEAYDVATMSSSGKNIFAYMDKVLARWHEAGCKTLSDCKAQREGQKATYNSAPTAQRMSKTRPETPRYGNFDIDDAFAKALERSYGEGKED